MAQITFEVYAFDGRRWTLQQTFSASQREAATALAQELYAEPHLRGVRVMQETYDPETGESDEKPLLTRTKSDDVPKNLKKEIGKAPEPAKPAAKKKTPPPVASKPVAGLPQAAPAAAPKARAETWHRTTPGRASSLTAAGGAVVAGSALLLLQSGGEAPALLPGALSGHNLFAVSVVLMGVGVAGAGFILLDAAGQRGLLPGIFYEELPYPAPGEPAAPRPVFPVLDIEEDEPPADATALPGNLPAEAVRLVAFLHDALLALPREGPHMKDGKLDAFNWFGCHLFFAGLCDEEARRNAWPAALTRQVITVAMTAALGDAAAAARFAARYEDYLTEPRSLAMFGRGGAAAQQRATGDAQAKTALQQALADWNQRTEAGPETGHVAVMFTDIVGSTDFTQTHGDAKHFEMVQAHDRIVRAALQEFAGREIKHTGDGIMAAFDDAALGVRAAQRVQREIKAHREVAPEIGMGLRIGLAAGEPIKAGNDLFGSTVQLAARICAVATTDQVVITDPVRAICAPLGIEFVDLGERPLKGFKQPVRVHAIFSS
jgi:adenylate cyclase